MQKVDQFEQLATAAKMSDPAKRAALQKLDLPALRQKLAWLKTTLPSSLNMDGQLLLDAMQSDDEITRQAHAFAFDVVFCHNDALSGNILHHADWDRVQIIDYEYGAFNFRAFDFANHFCEHCGFDMDLALYPNPDQQFVFFKAYMQTAAPTLLKALEANKESKAFCHALYDAVNRFALASQAANSKIDFDFLDYARMRFDAFEKQKSFFFALDGASGDK